jgi:hypothetical protein
LHHKRETISKEKLGSTNLEKKMKLTVKFALAAASTLLVTSAFANTYMTSVAPAVPNSVYVSADAGYGFLSVPDEDIYAADGIFVSESSHQTGSVAGGGSVGINHALTNNVLVGAEFGYDYNGQAKYTENYLPVSIQPVNPYTSSTIKITSTDFHLLATATYLFPYRFNVFAKAGGARVEQKVTFTNADDSNTTQYLPMVATGVGYQVRMLNFYVQYAHIFGENVNHFTGNDYYFSNNLNLSNVVSSDTIKAGVAVNIAI